MQLGGGVVGVGFLTMNKTIKTLFLSCLTILGIAILFIGAVLPLRLPRSERDLGRETMATIVGLGLTLAPIAIQRRKNG
jgi:hypothetical protein